MKKQNPMPSVEFLKECFEYHEDGYLIWKKRPLHHFSSEHFMKVSNTQFAGKRAGSKHHSGYTYVRINGKEFAMHRVIYSMHIGSITAGVEIDHRNGDRENSKIANLRSSSYGGQAHNAALRLDNTSGFKGVSLEASTKKYRAYINHLGKRKYLGRFKFAEDAARAYDDEALKLHGEFAVLNFKKNGARDAIAA